VSEFISILDAFYEDKIDEVREKFRRLVKGKRVIDIKIFEDEEADVVIILEDGTRICAGGYDYDFWVES